MGTTTALELNRRLSEAMGDYLATVVTTNIGANTLVVSTHLNQFDGGRNDYFTDWWLYINSQQNNDKDRRIRNYYTANATANVFGANYASDTNIADIRIQRYSYTEKQRAINDAIREVYPVLHRQLDVYELVSRNILPNSHFRDWALTTKPDKYNVSSATATANTGAGFSRGGNKSARVVASAANGYLYITSDDYPQLLDLMGDTIDFRAWARPTKADDAKLTIYTEKADGTAQTLDSTTACPANAFTLLKLEDQKLNDDLTKIEFRFRVATNAQSAHFDNARAIGHAIYEYLLPSDFRDGALSDVRIQTDGGDCDTLRPSAWAREYRWEVLDDGTDKWLKMPNSYPAEKLIRLIGYAPFSTLSGPTNTIETDEERHLALLTAYAKYKMYQRTEQPVSSEDKRRYESESAKAFNEYKRLLPKGRSATPRGSLRI